MLKLFSDWGFLQVLIAVLALILTGGSVAFAIYQYITDKKRRRKELHCQLLYNDSLVSVQDVLKDKIQMFLDGKQINNPSLVICKFNNAGGSSIREEDYKKPLAMKFGSEARILSVEVTDFEPSVLEITSEIIDSKIILNCPLLNEQDAFKVKVIGDNLDELSIEGRIDGVHQIKVYKETESTEEVVNKKRAFPFSKQAQSILGTIGMTVFILLLVALVI